MRVYNDDGKKDKDGIDDGSGSYHWEVLIKRTAYDTAKLTGVTLKTHSTADAKMLKPDGKPRHVFGSPGSVHDPEAAPIAVEVKEIDDGK